MRGDHSRAGGAGFPSGGNIPACAGTTRAQHRPRISRREHPRMRGDHCFISCCALSITGTSPHARGPHEIRILGEVHRGNIPACAGTTQPSGRRARWSREHPRMRGDHTLLDCDTVIDAGTSPHARGPLVCRLPPVVAVGNIPACAGTTSTATPTRSGEREHPRMRGDHSLISVPDVELVGTSPHARGPLKADHRRYLDVGNIPACAGTTTPLKWPRRATREHPRMRGDHASSSAAGIMQ